MKHIYLDYAAATPLDSDVFAAMRPYFSDKFHNPSAIYLAARSVGQSLAAARASVAGWLGAKPAEIVFTAGATEANNLAIAGIMTKYPDGEVLVSAVEHDSVLEPAAQYNRQLIPVRPDGRLDLTKLEKMIGDRTVLVSVMYVNNELGTVQPLKEVASLVASVRAGRLKKSDKTPIYFHSDAAQAGNFLDLHVARLGVDMMSLNGGKLYGPKQSGILFVRTGLKLQPLILGGGQEGGLRSGTENSAGIVGLAAALDKAQAGRRREAARITELRRSFTEGLISTVPTAIINGSNKHQAPHLINVTIPGIDNERLIMELDEAGIQAAAGSACAAGDEQSSHVLAAIGLDEALARATLRFSLGRSTTAADIKKTVATLRALTAQLTQ